MPFEEHPLFTPPGDRGAPIFRYMDLAKFVSLLDTHKLYFARSDRLGDDFEGSVTQANLDLRPNWYPELPRDVVQSIQRQIVDSHRLSRFWTFINCWTASPTESVAMWRLYVGDGNGLAIESTYERLVSAAGGEKPVYVGMVNYTDWRTGIIPEGNALAPFLYKRAGFDYERELRAIASQIPVTDRGIDSSQTSPPGLSIPVDVPALIARVRLSPLAERWYHEVVASVIAKYGCELEVAQSDLSGQPVY